MSNVWILRFQDTPLLCILTMVKNDEKHSKMMKKVPLLSCAWEAHVRHMKKNEEKSLLVSNWEFTWASQTHNQKDTFSWFLIFSIVFDHANTCSSMHLLVKIHNTPQIEKLWKCLTFTKSCSLIIIFFYYSRSCEQNRFYMGTAVFSYVNKTENWWQIKLTNCLPYWKGNH